MLNSFRLDQKINKLFGILVTAGLFALIGSRALLTEADTDIWGHVRFGQDILKAGAVLFKDQYSYLSGQTKWINHEWLSEVVFALFYNAAGAPGLVALKCFFILTICFLLWRSLLKNGFRLVPAAIVMIIAELLCGSIFSTLRPHLFTALFFTFELLIISEYTGKIDVKKRSLGILFLPFLFMVWANIHGGFVMGLSTLTAWWGATVLEIALTDGLREVLRRWILVLVLPVSVIAIFINPYGLELINFLVTVNRMDRVLSLQGPFVSEWRPLLKVSIVYGIYYAVTLCIVIGGFFYSRKAKHLGTVLVWLMLTSAAFLIYRTLPFYSIGTVILAGPHLADCWNRLYDRIARREYIYGILLMTTVAVMVLSVAGLVSQLRGIPGQLVILGPMPIKAVSLLKQANIKANVLVEFNWAEYFIWHLSPQMKVAIDPRCETAYSDYVLFNLYCGFITTSRHWDDILDKVPTDLVLISPNTIVGSLLEKKLGWEKIYTDSTCCIFAKNDSRVKYILAGLNEKYSVPAGKINVFP